MSQVLALSGLRADGRRDEFFYLCAINRASLVVNRAGGLLSEEQARRFAPAIAAVTRAGELDAAQRPDRVIRLEPKLIAIVGPEIADLHVGRSSQDMHSTFRLALLRDATLDTVDALNGLIEVFSERAAEYAAVPVPSYTNGVAAQPNTLGHYLLGVSEGFIRDRERLCQLYPRVNRSSMGSTVLNGTGWPLDREAMARRLGFDGIIVNAYDATQIATFDLAIEYAQILQSLAVHLSGFIQDVMQQYSQSRPWMLLREGDDTTYVSSAMPQKRNPGLLNDTRALAARVSARALEFVMTAHNVVTGMPDAKGVAPRAELTALALDLCARGGRILRALRVDPERALEELNSDWTAAQEVADILLRRHGVPFRVGHHVVSAMVGWARQRGVRPLEFPYDEMRRLFAEVTEREWRAAELPMSEEEFKRALDPVSIINERATVGGPQPDSVAAMLAERARANAAARAWAESSRRRVDDALLALEREFSQYLVES